MQRASRRAHESTRMCFREAYNELLQTAKSIELVVSWRDDTITLHKQRDPKRTLCTFPLDAIVDPTMDETMRIRTPSGVQYFAHEQADEAWTALRKYVVETERRLGTVRYEDNSFKSYGGTVLVRGLRDTFGKLSIRNVLVLPEDFCMYHTDDASKPGADSTLLHNHSSLLFFPLTHYHHILHLK